MDLFSKLFAGVTVTISLGDALALGVVIIGYIAWLIRLEAKVYWLEKDHSNRKAEQEKKDQAIWDKFETAQNTMNQILIALGELKGQVGSKDAR